MRTKLSVNLNKVALLRNQRHRNSPNILDAARAAILAGADGITVHPRPDQRHIRHDDVREIGHLLRSEYTAAIEFNVEGYPSDDFLALVADVEPTQVTLVPDTPDQLTSDHGWDLSIEASFLRNIIDGIAKQRSRVSLFIDPDLSAVPHVAHTGAHRIELYTQPYADAYNAGKYSNMLNRYATVAQAAAAYGLGVNAGHDLTLQNLRPFAKHIPQLAEVSIGHAIAAAALERGFASAVAAFARAID